MNIFIMIINTLSISFNLYYYLTLGSILNLCIIPLNLLAILLLAIVLIKE